MNEHFFRSNETYRTTNTGMNQSVLIPKATQFRHIKQSPRAESQSVDLSFYRQSEGVYFANIIKTCISELKKNVTGCVFTPNQLNAVINCCSEYDLEVLQRSDNKFWYIRRKV